MPEHLRALPVVLFIATAVLAFARAPVVASAMAPADFSLRRKLWFALTLAAFLAHNFWVYILFGAALLVAAAPRDRNPLALFFFVLFAVPAIPAQISGLGLVNYLFAISHVRLLALAVLLPAFFALSLRPEVERFGRTLPDKLLCGYLLLHFVLQLQSDSFTNSLRSGLFYAFVDVFLPYFVASRSLRDAKAFRDVLAAFAVAAMVLGTMGVFESLKHWNLYDALQGALGAQWEWDGYLLRGDGVLRAKASTGQPIPLGYVLAVGLGFYLYLWKLIPGTRWRLAGLVVLIAGLLAPLSRGPWMGAVAMATLYAMTGRVTGARIAALWLAGAAGLALVLSADNIADYLPLAQSIDEGSVLYRQRLIEISIAEILKNPWFGGFALHSPAFEELRQGQGIIDIVNTYVAVGLTSGLVGLALFTGFFLAILAGVLNGLRRLSDRDGENYRLGRALAATLIGILIIIFTVSSVSIIPVVYWSVAGMGAGYVLMLARDRASLRAPRPVTAATRYGAAA